MNKKLKISILFLCLFILATAAVLILRSNRIENKFPLWEEITEPRMQTSDIAVTYKGSEFDAESGEFNIQVELANSSDKHASYGFDYFLDYQHEDTWFCVYYPNEIISLGIVLDANDTHDRKYSVPKKALTEKGQYRLFIPNLGYCVFEIT